MADKDGKPPKYTPTRITKNFDNFIKNSFYKNSDKLMKPNIFTAKPKDVLLDAIDDYFNKHPKDAKAILKEYMFDDRDELERVLIASNKDKFKLYPSFRSQVTGTGLKDKFQGPPTKDGKRPKPIGQLNLLGGVTGPGGKPKKEIDSKEIKKAIAESYKKTVNRKKGGSISKSKKPRGVGAATRGYGKALTGRKK